MFLIIPFRNDQERVPKVTECVLDRSILERFPLFLEHFLFLKKSFDFLERVLKRVFGKFFTGFTVEIDSRKEEKSG